MQECFRMSRLQEHIPNKERTPNHNKKGIRFIEWQKFLAKNIAGEPVPGVPQPYWMTIAKAMGGGVPIGAFLCKDACDVLRPGDHGSTYGGNALTCAASYAVLNHVKEEGLVEHGRLMGERLKGKLEEVKARHETTIKEVRGMGLLLAVEFHEPISGELVTSCNAGGLLLNPVRPTAVRFMPPLNISESEVDIAVDRFERSLEDALQRIEKAK